MVATWNLFRMKDPHNYAKVGYSMILVSASLAAIAIIGLFIGEDVLFGDNIQRAKTAEFEYCKSVNFEAVSCEQFLDRINNPIADVWTEPRA